MENEDYEKYENSGVNSTENETTNPEPPKTDFTGADNTNGSDDKYSPYQASPTETYTQNSGYYNNVVNGPSADNGYRQSDPAGKNDNPGTNRYPYSNPAPGGARPYQYNNGYYNGNHQQNPVNGYNNPYPYSGNGGGHAYNPDNSSQKKKGNGGKIFGIVAASLCVVLIVALVYVISHDGKKIPSVDKNTNETVTQDKENVEDIITQQSPETAETGSVNGELSAKAIYKKVMNTSVGILVYGKNNSVASEGSGVLFSEDKDGKYTYIITCAHVIADTANGIVVQLADETEYTAKVVGYDHKTDIGVLRIEAHGLQLAEIGDSTKLAVGDIVYAVGNPGGVEFANSFTNGMISALDRPVNSTSSGYTMECIQHTAAINPGNSGGQLVNTFGQVIGINSMKIVDDEYEGMGFSVPSSVFTKIVNELIKNGYVSNRPKLGITYVSASQYNSYGMFIALKGLPSGSIVIYSIGENSSLEGTEAEEGDMIVAVNGKNLDSPSMLSEYIEKCSVGDEITLSLVRINKDYTYKEFKVKAKLVEDRGDKIVSEEKETTQNYDDYEDYFRQFFNDDFFGDFFGGNTRP